MRGRAAAAIEGHSAAAMKWAQMEEPRQKLILRAADPQVEMMQSRESDDEGETASLARYLGDCTLPSSLPSVVVVDVAGPKGTTHVDYFEVRRQR